MKLAVTVVNELLMLWWLFLWKYPNTSWVLHLSVPRALRNLTIWNTTCFWLSASHYESKLDLLGFIRPQHVDKLNVPTLILQGTFRQGRYNFSLKLWKTVTFHLPVDVKNTDLSVLNTITKTASPVRPVAVLRRWKTDKKSGTYLLIDV